MDFNVPLVKISGQQTVSSTALKLEDFTAITTALVEASSRIWLTVNTSAVRIRYDGTTPLVTVGHRLTAGNDILLSGNENMKNFEIIRDAATDAEVFVTLEG